MPDKEWIAKLRKLRQESDASLQDCKRALEAADGDIAAGLLRLEEHKLEEVRRRGECSELVARRALAHAAGDLERAIEITKAPSIDVLPEFERVTNRARVLLAEAAPSLGLYELRDALPHAGASSITATLGLVFEFHSIMSACDVETFLANDEDNDVVGTQEALEEVGASNLARYLKLAVDGPQHMEARKRLAREFFGEERPLLIAVLGYIDGNTDALFRTPPFA